MILEVMCCDLRGEDSHVCYPLWCYLVFEGLSFRAASRVLEAFTCRSHVSVCVGFSVFHL